MLRRLAYILSWIIFGSLFGSIAVICTPLITISVIISIIGYILIGELNRKGFFDSWLMLSLSPMLFPLEVVVKLMNYIENKLFKNEKRN